MSLVISNQDTVLSTTAQVVASSQALTQVTILKATCVNVDTANAHSLTVYRLPVGASPATNYIMFDNAVVGAGKYITLDMSGQSINGGAVFSAVCDANSVINFNVSFATQS